MSSSEKRRETRWDQITWHTHFTGCHLQERDKRRQRQDQESWFVAAYGGKDFFTFDADVYLDSRMTWLDLGR